MRINEVTTPATSNLVTALQLLKNRYSGQNAPAKINTQSLINLVRNTDQAFSYDALVQAQENDPAVKNLIKSFNKDEVIFASDSEEGTEVGTEKKGNDNTVPNMAKKAAKARQAPLFK